MAQVFVDSTKITSRDIHGEKTRAPIWKPIIFQLQHRQGYKEFALLLQPHHLTHLSG